MSNNLNNGTHLVPYAKRGTYTRNLSGHTFIVTSANRQWLITMQNDKHSMSGTAEQFCTREALAVAQADGASFSTVEEMKAYYNNVDELLRRL